MTEAAETPTCLSIILCESIYRDEKTKNLILVGTFNRVRAVTGFPLQHPKACVLFTLTGGPGQYDVSLTVEHEETSQALLEMRGPMTLTDPLSINDFVVELHGLQFPEPGKYWIVLKANEAILNQRPLEVVDAREEEEDTDGSVAPLE